MTTSKTSVSTENTATESTPFVVLRKMIRSPLLARASMQKHARRSLSVNSWILSPPTVVDDRAVGPSVDSSHSYAQIVEPRPTVPTTEATSSLRKPKRIIRNGENRRSAASIGGNRPISPKDLKDTNEARRRRFGVLKFRPDFLQFLCRPFCRFALILIALFFHSILSFSTQDEFTSTLSTVTLTPVPFFIWSHTFSISFLLTTLVIILVGDRLPKMPILFSSIVLTFLASIIAGVVQVQREIQSLDQSVAVCSSIISLSPAASAFRQVTSTSGHCSSPSWPTLPLTVVRVLLGIAGAPLYTIGVNYVIGLSTMALSIYFSTAFCAKLVILAIQHWTDGFDLHFLCVAVTFIVFIIHIGMPPIRSGEPSVLIKPNSNPISALVLSVKMAAKTFVLAALVSESSQIVSLYLTSTTNTTATAVAVATSIVALLIGGLLARHGGRRAMLILIFVGSSMACAASAVFLVKCNAADEMASVRLNATSFQSILSRSCNEGCQCPTTYNPVCHLASGREFHSPCLAGCTRASSSSSWSNCRCARAAVLSTLGDDFAAINSISPDEEWRVEDGPCEVQCDTYMPVVFMGIAVLFVALHVITVPLLYKVVAGDGCPRQTAVVGVGAVVGTVAGPPVLRAVLWQACTHWDEWTCQETEGSCRAYNQETIGRPLFVFAVIAGGVQILAAIVALLAHRPTDNRAKNTTHSFSRTAKMETDV